MAIPSKKEFSEIPQKPVGQIAYEVSVVAYNKDTNRWENVPPEAGRKTAQFIKTEGALEFFKKAQPGDVLEVTEKGIYKKEGDRWVSALTEKEAKKKFPTVTKLMKILANKVLGLFKTQKQNVSEELEQVSKDFIKNVVDYEKDEVKPKVIMQIKVHFLMFQPFEKVESIAKKSITAEFQRNPEFAKTLQQNLDHLKRLHKGYEARCRAMLTETDNDKVQDLRKQISEFEVAMYATEQEILLSTEAAKANQVAQETIKTFRKQEDLERVGKGKVKQVFVDPDDPEYVLYTTVDSLFQSVFDPRERELRDELQTSNAILTGIHQFNLMELFAKKEIFGGIEEDIIYAIFRGFPSLKEFSIALESNDVNLLVRKTGIDEKHVQELLNLKEDIKRIEKMPINIEVELEEVPEEKRIGGKLTLRGKRGIDDLEKVLRNTKTSLSQRAKFVSGLLNSTVQLHNAGLNGRGYLHGDPKPGNVLVYSDGSIREIDLGKAKPVRGNESYINVGNPRFAPPEGKISKPGDIYSKALMAIYTLEADLLDPATNMLIAPSGLDPLVPKGKYWGIEEYVVTSNRTLQSDTTTFVGKFRVYSSRMSMMMAPSLQEPTPQQFKDAEDEVHRYIDVLTSKLQTEKNVPAEKADELNELLKEATSSDLTKRPIAEEFQTRFDALGL